MSPEKTALIEKLSTNFGLVTLALDELKIQREIFDEWMATDSEFFEAVQDALKLAHSKQNDEIRAAALRIALGDGERQKPNPTMLKFLVSETKAFDDAPTLKSKTLAEYTTEEIRVELLRRQKLSIAK